MAPGACLSWPPWLCVVRSVNMGIVPNFWELGGEDAAVLNSVANSLANIPGFASVPTPIMTMMLLT